MRILLILLCLFTTAFSGDSRPPNALPAEVSAAFSNGTKFILFSLEPPPIPDFDAPPPKPIEGHHGFKILGSTELADAPSRASAFAAIGDAVRGFNGLVAGCFEPRHSLRVITRDGKVFDLVTCFACHAVRIYRDDKLIAIVGITGSQKRLDDILTAAKVPLAPKPQTTK